MEGRVGVSTGERGVRGERRIERTEVDREMAPVGGAWNFSSGLPTGNAKSWQKGMSF
jgi:hypothetical protein